MELDYQHLLQSYASQLLIAVDIPLVMVDREVPCITP